MLRLAGNTKISNKCYVFTMLSWQFFLVWRKIVDRPNIRIFIQVTIVYVNIYIRIRNHTNIHVLEYAIS